MKKIKKLNLILIVILIVLSGCQKNTIKESSSSIEGFDQIYELVLDQLMKQEESLNNDITYIAIDTDSFLGATDDEMLEVTASLIGYDTLIIEESIGSLIEKNMFNEDGNLDGLFLTIESIEIVSNTDVIVYCYKSRGGKAAIGISVKLIKSDDSWEIHEINYTWES